MRPQDVAARPALPDRNISTPNHGPRAGALSIQDEQIVGPRLHAELWRPAIADSGELGTEPAADAIHARREDPRAVGLELALWDARRHAFCAEGSRGFLGPGGIGVGRNERHWVNGSP